MKIILLICFLLTASAGYLLRSLNLRHLRRHGAEVPPGFEGAVDRALLARSSAYTLELSRVGLLGSLLENLLILLFFFGGLLGAYDRSLASLGGPFVLAGVLFFLGLSLAEIVVDIPFSLYTTFRIENRYGFNTTTTRLWLTDLVKSALLGLFFLVLLAGGALAIVQFSPRLWWLWVWAFFALVTLFLIYLSPYLIEPLFNKYEPLQAEGLEQEIRGLLAKAGLSVSRVLQVDASRRSRHSNAYFTGVGRVKRIVLYDTLLEQMSHGEILAILAHEVGHWKKGHVWKRLLLTEVGGLAVCYAAFRLLGWGGLPGLVGLPQASFPAQTVILGFVASLAAFPLIPLGSWLSRRNEWEADRFAADLTGAPVNLATALIKLSRENLANLHPHPLYARFYYSHPPVLERVGKLRSAEDLKRGS
ncbi:MAG: M48 family metallopeptidase [Geobacteraceae bacterium]|nr:M48 family metallopeptidase [Geobacteraceae bacterium]